MTCGDRRVNPALNNADILRDDHHKQFRKQEVNHGKTRS
ncbi:hypothetical protein AS9A_0810 [Hoyosella subflava DQS3-9A1]|uniref:Uncharacterized protein n=1 Tax=Hoyosella subflava (strain DSM 45089 / JCM 17490 / NBRC 109087 / DQS3-9A1) TaxID=443218 RepID=F6EM56_HOYSD|nr:hypothetical protein AS9A_0810 [Hoyosella subflava DQS3-9A1]